MKRKPPPDREALASAWATKTRAQICKEFGFGLTALCSWVKRYNLGLRPPQASCVDPLALAAAYGSGKRAEVCRKLGCSPSTFVRQARKLGLKRSPVAPDRNSLAAAWETMTIKEICEAFRMGRSAIFRWAKKYGLGPKPRGRSFTSPGEILACTRAIQQSWSDAKRERRAGRSKLSVAAKAMGYDGRSARFTEKSL